MSAPSSATSESLLARRPSIDAFPQITSAGEFSTSRADTVEQRRGWMDPTSVEDHLAPRLTLYRDNLLVVTINYGDSGWGDRERKGYNVRFGNGCPQEREFLQLLRNSIEIGAAVKKCGVAIGISAGIVDKTLYFYNVASGEWIAPDQADDYRKILRELYEATQFPELPTSLRAPKAGTLGRSTIITPKPTVCCESAAAAADVVGVLLGKASDVTENRAVRGALKDFLWKCANTHKQQGDITLSAAHDGLPESVKTLLGDRAVTLTIGASSGSANGYSFQFKEVDQETVTTIRALASTDKISIKSISDTRIISCAVTCVGNFAVTDLSGLLTPDHNRALRERNRTIPDFIIGPEHGGEKHKVNLHLSVRKGSGVEAVLQNASLNGSRVWRFFNTNDAGAHLVVQVRSNNVGANLDGIALLVAARLNAKGQAT